MAGRQIKVDSCEHGEHPCPMFDNEMTGCQLADFLGIEDVSCAQARYGRTDEEYHDWLRNCRKARDKGEQEPEMPDNPIPYPDNCPLKAGPYTIELI